MKADTFNRTAKNSAKQRSASVFGLHASSDNGKIHAVPTMLFYYLIFVSLTLPNIIFSGTGWFDTLHIMKWTFAMVPIAVMALVGGTRLALYGEERTGFKIDLFGWAWFIMLGYISLQPLWVPILSWSTYMKEWLFFATLAGAYVFSYNQFKDSGYHKLILWFANINAALNVIFAELLIRNLNGPFPFIMNVPGNYIGNTGQQNMFAMWISMAIMNGIYLHVAFGSEEGKGHQSKWMQWGNLLILAVNAWGLWNSTSRSGILALAAGSAVLFIIVLRSGSKPRLKRMFQMFAVIAFMLAMTLGLGHVLHTGRSDALVSKTEDIFKNVATVGNRVEIWRSTFGVISTAPIKGVGIGQYKWHYLDGQRIAFEKHPEMEWQFTYWAHSEYLQWYAEFGLFGGLLLAALGIWWLWSFICAMVNKKVLSAEASWACSLLALVWFVALFSRPFHRIENALWVAFAFAIINRELLPASFKWSEIRHSSIYRVLGVFMAVVSVAGLIFLYGGLRGDQYLRSSVRTNNAGLQAYKISQAMKMPMARDEAEEQYAYHLLAVANATHKPEDYAKAINQLYRSFTIRPQAKQLMELVRFAQQTGNQELLRRLVPYLKPGAFRVVPGVPQSQ